MRRLREKTSHSTVPPVSTSGTLQSGPGRSQDGCSLTSETIHGVTEAFSETPGVRQKCRTPPQPLPPSIKPTPSQPHFFHYTKHPSLSHLVPFALLPAKFPGHPLRGSWSYTLAGVHPSNCPLCLECPISSALPTDVFMFQSPAHLHSSLVHSSIH